MKILPVIGKKRLNFGSDLDASAMSQPPNTAENRENENRSD